jgi:hypothetical protein
MVPWAGTARQKLSWPMGGMARVNGPCAVLWAEGLAHSTVSHDTVSTAARRGMSLPRVVPARHGGQLWGR